MRGEITTESLSHKHATYLSSTRIQSTAKDFTNTGIKQDVLCPKFKAIEKPSEATK